MIIIIGRQIITYNTAHIIMSIGNYVIKVSSDTGQRSSKVIIFILRRLGHKWRHYGGFGGTLIILRFEK